MMYIPKSEPHQIVFAKHDCCDKEFIFAVPLHLDVKKGDMLLVETSKGLTIAVATSNIVEGQDVCEVAKKYGAYLPLKEVKQVVNQQLQEYIERRTVNAIINKLQCKTVNEIENIDYSSFLPF